MSPKALLLALVVVSSASVCVIACKEPPPTPAPPEPAPEVSASAATSAPDSSAPGTATSVTLQVPASMRSAPFDAERTLRVPPGFHAEVLARVPAARFLATVANGDIFVSQPSTGKVLLVRPVANADPQIFEWATGLRKPHDIVLHEMNGTTYVYVSETHQVSRYRFAAGETSAHDREALVTGLPDSSSPELGGAYGHELKNIAVDSQHRLFVSIASTCNACTSDTEATPVRGAIYVYASDGSNGHLYARGLRNAEGLAFVPGSDDLWVVVNNRDQILYPFDDASGNYGKLIPAYVDNHPPEEFTRVTDGGNYGWPFCNPNPDATVNGMPFDRDVEFNRDGHVDCAAMNRIDKGIQAHSAPLGLLFLPATVPEPYRGGAAIALHGSWNRTSKTGYKVIFFPWADGRPGDQVDLVSGFLNGESAWGRPVDVAVTPSGALLVSDDAAGAIYRFTYGG